MAGKNISDYLNPPDLDHFYDLYHDLTEAIKSKTISIHGFCKVMQQAASEDPEIFPNTEDILHLDTFTAYAGEFGITMQNFYWPYSTADRRQDKILNMKRWAPYDEAAWDNMVSQMIKLLQPFVQSARDHYKIMVSYSLGTSSRANKMKELSAPIGRYLDRLSHLCNPDNIESLFRFSPNQG